MPPPAPTLSAGLLQGTKDQVPAQQAWHGSMARPRRRVLLRYLCLEEGLLVTILDDTGGILGRRRRGCGGGGWPSSSEGAKSKRPARFLRNFPRAIPHRPRLTLTVGAGAGRGPDGCTTVFVPCRPSIFVACRQSPQNKYSNPPRPPSRTFGLFSPLLPSSPTVSVASFVPIHSFPASQLLCSTALDFHFPVHGHLV